MSLSRNSDLHMHSTASDGGYSPTKLMEKCHQANLKFVALTDHDTVNGIEEAKQTAHRLGLTLIPGIELSTKSSGQSVHMLGYGIDWKNDTLKRRLDRQQDIRKQRLEQILLKLKAAGVPLEQDAVLRYADGGAIGRPHVAKALMDKGYVRSVQEAFEHYLAEGRPCYVKRQEYISVEQAIAWIHQAGGVAIVAHPGYYDLDDQLIGWVREYGLDGIEVYHRDHSREVVAHYEQLCKRMEAETGRRLLRTGGSDFHHESYGRTAAPLGTTRIPDQLTYELLHDLERKKTRA
ncbi:PHP domain-containing protein [Halalkalibacterium halodurans]|uniref:Polymerase/histidinol phosphatase N-terminal domain-containing protein n=1 Tax=Halalkalibacterium halodurans TaxID=86665 RepID=A0A0M0KJW8_ALKHA|nr:PHP domain-containing protein [Halalkalibacterium halodurans]MED3647007.1 PHP domain-containing protein [Halalkalibacterium halodurans]TES57572.1 PHP domain-containing protein [Halalkalibacterium halodurans]TPE70157.1 PHP domain-containing protein [Halalkalibacterium halodurans]